MVTVKTTYNNSSRMTDREIDIEKGNVKVNENQGYRVFHLPDDVAIDFAEKLLAASPALKIVRHPKLIKLAKMIIAVQEDEDQQE